MGRMLVEQMLPTLEKLTWEGEEEATSAGALVFRTAIDQVDAYRGDPRDLAAAVRTLRTSQSLPYAYAGVAYVLIAASSDEHGSWYQPGLEDALAWLERAQALEPDIVDINAVEALIYIYGGRYNDATLVLEYLLDQEPNNYYVLRAMMILWQQQGDLEKALSWNEKAMAAAETVPQRLRLKSIVGDLHLRAGNKAAARAILEEALHFDPDNAWLCHRISVLYHEEGNVEESARYNQRALRLQPGLVEAEALREQLEEGSGSGLLGRLFG
jgi:tetratricopeptide (TPR) repeat protein